MNLTYLKNNINRLRGEEDQNRLAHSTLPNLNTIFPNVHQGTILEANSSLTLDTIYSNGQGFMATSDSRNKEQGTTNYLILILHRYINLV